MHPEYFETRFRTPEPVEGWPAEFAIISAHATTGESWAHQTNDARDAELQQTLAQRSTWIQRIEGYSPTTGHAEPSWAVEIPLRQACEIGREFKQDAIYHVQAGKLYVTCCEGEPALVLVDEFAGRVCHEPS